MLVRAASTLALTYNTIQDTRDMATLNIYLLGSPRIDLDGQSVAFERNKAAALLAYLAMENGAHGRETLAALLWPEYDHERAYAYLRRTLWSIHEALGDGWLEAGREQIALLRSPDLRLDVAYFWDALEECSQHGHSVDQVCGRCIQPLEQAVVFYRGDFMTGFSLRDSAGFDEWQYFQSEKLKSELASALRRLANAYTAQGAYDQAVMAGRRWLALDLLNEEAHRQLMLVYAQAGQRNAAVRQYQECQRILMDEIGVEPQQETTQLFESIKTGDLVGTAHLAANVPSATLTVPPAKLPYPTSPFIGRVQELDEIDKLLNQPECRLLTLLGPGGIGKTRLSIQAAHRHADRRPSGFTDGVVFIPLSPVNSAESLTPAIASGLKLQFRSQQIRQDTPETQKVQLVEYLRNRQMLLVLDNFEHLVAGAGLLVEILDSCPGLKMLVTTRERLRLTDEWVFEVSGMSYPDDDNLEALESYSAVQLFLQDARRVRADFKPTEADNASIVHICQLVEGAPLAIELAATWVKLLSCGEIAAEIERNLDFLSAALRNLPERHQSLRAVFEHSWSLLAPDEQAALRRLSVLRSPFQRETAAAIVMGDGESSATESTAAGAMRDSAGPGSSAAFLQLLSALADKSMLRRATGAGLEGRFSMHELVRQYAAEKLKQIPGETELAQGRHVQYYAAWLEKMSQELRGHRQIHALNQIEAEIEDVRSAWRWMVGRSDSQALRRAMDALFWYYNIRSRQEEAEEDLRLAVEGLASWQSRPGDPLPAAGEAVYALLLAYYSQALFSSGDFQQGRAMSEKALALAERLAGQEQAQLTLLLYFGNGSLPGDEVEKHYGQSLQSFQRTGNRWAVAMAMLIYVNYAQYTLVDMELSRRLLQDSLALFRELGDRVGMVAALNEQAALSYSLGAYEEAKRFSQESLLLGQALGDRWRVATGLLNQGQACVALGEYPQARQVYLEALQLVRELGNRRVVARYLACLGYVNYLEGEFGKADEFFREALELSRQIDDRREMGMSNMNLGNIALADGEQAAARRFYLAAIDLLADIGFARWEYSICLKRMGGLCFKLGEISQAEDYCQQALEISRQLKRTPEILDNLVGIAELAGSEGRVVQAVEWLALVLKHEECAREVRERAQSLLAGYQAALPATVFGSAVRDGQAKSLEQALIELSK
jgi:predicted ATPase/DNA-binding SARP family transcriptional activator